MKSTYGKTGNLKTYWEEIRDLLHTYDTASSPVEPSNSLDNDTYLKAREILEKMIAVGMKIEETDSKLEKISLGLQLNRLTDEQFKLEELPHIPGKKSFHFSKAVLLPMLKKSLEIQHSKGVKIVSITVGININQKMQKAEELVKKLKILIKQYKDSSFSTNVKNTAILNQQGTFRSPKEEKKPIHNSEEKQIHFRPI